MTMGSTVATPSMRVLVCPSGFKGSLQPNEAADCIEAGILAVEPNASVRKVPLVDGGEGFTQAIVTATGGSMHRVHVVGPVGEEVTSFFGVLGRKDDEPTTAVLEMAAAAGLSLVPPNSRNPGKTTTFGVGQLILAAL